MTMNLRSNSDKDSQAKKEDDFSVHNNIIPKIPSNSSRHWSNYKNPRIVRMSRAFGGKDRHSKVCTLRGLKDRRIRLSAPTAIQLYDLQDRLGLNQPSKVVDWLLDATKHDIDKLPPLPMIPIHHSAVPSSHSFGFTPQSSLPHFINSNYVMAKEDNEKEGFGGFVVQSSAQNLFPLNTNYNQQNNLLPNLPYNSYFLNQSEEQRPSSDLQYFCPSAMPPFIHSFPPVDDELRQMNPLLPTTLSLISNSAMKPLVDQHVNSRTVFLPENDGRRWPQDSTSKP